MDIRPYIIPNQSRILYDPNYAEGNMRYVCNKLLQAGFKAIAFSDVDFGCPQAPWNNQKYHTWNVAVVSDDWYYRCYDGNCTEWHEYQNSNGDTTGAILIRRDAPANTWYHGANNQCSDCQPGGSFNCIALPVSRSVRKGNSDCVVDPWGGFNPCTRFYEESITITNFGTLLGLVVVEWSPNREEKFWFAKDVGLVKYSRPGFSRNWTTFYQNGDGGITLTTCKGNF